jgi:hypothetical protein
LTLTSKGTSTGIAKLFGLPFTVPDNNESQTTASIWLSGVSFANQYQTRIQTGTQKLIFGEITEAGVQTNMDNTNFSDTSTVRISMTYLV